MAHPTITDRWRVESFTLSGTDSVTLPASFPVFTKDGVITDADLEVYIDGVLKPASEWSFSGTFTDGISAGGTITFDVNVTGTVKVYGALALAPRRTSDFSPGNVQTDPLNTTLDRIWACLREMEHQIQRCIKIPIPEADSDETPVDQVLPALAARKNKTLALDANGRPIVGTSDVVSGLIVFNVQDYGAVGDGVTDDTAAFQAAAAAAGTTGDIAVPDGTYKIASTVSLNVAHVFVSGVIKPDSGITLTLNGRVVASPYARIFDGDGTVYPAADHVWSFCWFGAHADNTNGAANSAARDRFMRAYDNVASRMQLYVPAGRYANAGAADYSDMLILHKPQTGIQGDGRDATWLQFGVQSMADDQVIAGLTINNVEFGVIFDHEGDTDYGQDNPRNGGAARTTYVPAQRRRLRGLLHEVTIFNCDWGLADIDDSPSPQQVGVWIAGSTNDGAFFEKGINTGDDMGVAMASNCQIVQSGRHNLHVTKIGTISYSNSKFFHNKALTNASPSVMIRARDQGGVNASGFEVIRQAWFDNCALETDTTQTFRQIGITAIADGGTDGNGDQVLTLTLDATHYLSRGAHLGCSIIGTTSYNEPIKVHAVNSDTEIEVVSTGTDFTFGSTETGTLQVPAIDLWMESEETSPKRVVRTQILGGGINTAVLLNVENFTAVGAALPKQSLYVRTSNHVSLIGAATGVVEDVAGYQLSDRYNVGHVPINQDTASQVFRSSWGDEFGQDYYGFMYNAAARFRLLKTGELELSGVDQQPHVQTYDEFAHGNAEIGGWRTYGRNSAATKFLFTEWRINVQDDTDTSEDVAVSLHYPIAGSNVQRWTWRRGLFSNLVTGGDPPLPGGINVAEVEVEGATAVDNSGGIRFPVYTAANIADIAHAVNTTDKAQGKGVWDSTNNRIMVAAGATAGAAWHVADGSASVTPA